jgi:hypothetical protein
VGHRRFGTSITFDGGLGIVAESGSGRVGEMDVPNRQTRGTVSVHGAPRALIMGPYPLALNCQTSNIVTVLALGAFALAIVIFAVVMIRDNIKRSVKAQGRSD